MLTDSEVQSRTEKVSRVRSRFEVETPALALAGDQSQKPSLPPILIQDVYGCGKVGCKDGTDRERNER